MLTKKIPSVLSAALAVLVFASFLPSFTPKTQAIGKNILPIPECKVILLQDNGSGVGVPTGTWRGVWGYWNQNAEVIDDNIQPGIFAGGSKNYFNIGNNNSSYNPGGPVNNSGQLSAFNPGRYYSVFSTDYSQHTFLGWYIIYPTLKAAFVNSQTANCNTAKTKLFVPQNEWYLYGIS
jgi:hypothetical protein